MSAEGWTIVAVMPSTGWSNVFRISGRETASESPAILLQQAPGGKTRAVFAAITTTGELVPALDIDGYRRTVTTEAWELGVSGVAGW